jgi:glycosyltransferase involved in cell wall biosynthesis
VIDSLAQAMLQLAENQRLRRKLGFSARRRVRSLFAWERKGEVLERLYQEAADRGRATGAS